MVCFRLDRNLQSFAKQSRCIYTRYADDITFSSYQPPTLLFDGALPEAGRFPRQALSGALRDIFLHNGFELNDEKSHYADKHSRKTVTGLRVNEILNVDRTYIRNVRAALFSIEKFGTASAQQKLMEKYDNPSGISAHLKGKIAWVGHVKGLADPVYRSLAVRYNSNFPSQKIAVEPKKIEQRDRAVWVVEDHDGGAQGTAFFLKSVGIITAWHCVDGVKDIELYHPSKSSNRFSAQIVKYCSHRDLVLLKHDIPKNEFYEIDLAATVNVGDAVTALGYPVFGPGDKMNVRHGHVSSFPTKSSVQLIEVTQKLVQGMSGGPIVDQNGYAVGVVHKGGPDELRDFGIHMSVLKAWLAEL